MIPLRIFWLQAPITFIFLRETLRPASRRLVITTGIIILAFCPENAKSSTHVEYVIAIRSHSVRIELKIVQIRMFASGVLVAAPWGRCPSNVVSCVKSLAISEEQLSTFLQI